MMTSLKFFKLFFTLFLLVALMSMCTTKKTSSSGEGFNDATFNSGFFPEFKVYHFSKDSSALHVKIKSSELLYTRSNPNSDFQSTLKISGVIRDDEGSFVDSITTGFSNSEKIPLDQILYSKTSFKLPEDSDYTLHLFYTDDKRKIKGTRTIRINKTDQFADENFLIYTPKSGFPEFNMHCNASFPIKIYSNRVDLRQIETAIKNAESTLPPPPYSKSSGTSPDLADFENTTFTTSENEISIDQVAFSDIYLHKNGEGLMFLIRPNNFPEVSTTSELASPMRYISSKREYERMYESDELKSKIDEFWLECGTTKDRAKVLISNYYQRVNYSNQHFSSFKSGWRTDKGLIYIIYGQPGEIVINPNSETWIYSGQNTLGSVEFKFNKVENSFTTNHFLLERNPLYKSEWSRRVNAWRNGRIYD